MTKITRKEEYKKGKKNKSKYNLKISDRKKLMKQCCEQMDIDPESPEMKMLFSTPMFEVSKILQLRWETYRIFIEWFENFYKTQYYDIEIANLGPDYMNVLIAYNRPDGTITIMDNMQAPYTHWVYTLGILCSDVTLYAIKFIPLYIENGEWHYYVDENGEQYSFGTGDITKDLSDGYACMDDFILEPF